MNQDRICLGIVEVSSHYVFAIRSFRSENRTSYPEILFAEFGPYSVKVSVEDPV